MTPALDLLVVKSKEDILAIVLRCWLVRRKPDFLGKFGSCLRDFREVLLKGGTTVCACVATTMAVISVETLTEVAQNLNAPASDCILTITDHRIDILSL